MRLPIHDQADEIVSAIQNHQVVVIEGPTGCGKTTQLPRILLRAGFMEGLIGVTQPRRIAAVSVAWRIAEEVGCEVGQEVGYSIRFDEKTSQETLVKIMTDGILLQEARTDPDFSRYQVIVIDEAHERSLNIDLCMGLLYRAVTRRSDLRVVISSATIDPEHFQRFFQGAVPEVPLVSVDARQHEVKVRYRPQPKEVNTLAQWVADEAWRVHQSGEEGHILAFLTGEAMIKEAQRALEKGKSRKPFKVLPLFGRLTRREQESIFDDLGETRKIVLATNIAETSITIPGVNTVIDTGLAKVPRFDGRTGITSLQEEPISKASLNQRTGRAGRTGPGLSLRLFHKSKYHQRAAFTEEEILRLDLTEVVLRLLALGVKDLEAFPLPTPLPRRRLKQALQVLGLLGAVTRDRALTEIGERMVPFPLSPRLSRMVVEATRSAPDLVEEVLIVGAFLSSRPPFVFPDGHEMEARQAHDDLAHPLGDAATAVTLFRRYQESRDQEYFCTRHHLDPHIMAFFVKVVDQLSDIASSRGVKVKGGGALEELARQVAAGFPDRILGRAGRVWQTLDGVEVAIHPSSALFGTRPRFVVAAELVRSRRVYARQASLVESRWLPEVSPAASRAWLSKREVKRAYSAPKNVSHPKALRVGDHYLKVKARKDKAMVTIPFELAGELSKVLRHDLPGEAFVWRARIVREKERFMGELTLAATLAVVPFLPLPEGPTPACKAPDGVLFDAERDLHRLERFLDMVLEPMRPRRGKQPGWLMLVTNGAGGYWFEISRSFLEVLEASADALENLVDEAYDEHDPGYEARVKQRDHVLTLREQVLQAVTESMKRGKR